MPLTLKNSLIEHDSSPVVAYGNDRGAFVEYPLATSEDSFTQELDEIREIAMNNLRDIQANMVLTKVAEMEVLIVEDCEYAAEKILDPTFLLRVQQKLGTDEILVGIPSHGCFLAIDHRKLEHVTSFLFILSKYYEDAPGNAISKHGFLIKDGAIQGYVKGSQKEEEKDEEEPFFKVMTLEETDQKRGYIIFFGHQNLTIARKYLDGALQNLLHEGASQKDVDIDIQVMLVPTIMERTEGLESLCQNLAEAAVGAFSQYASEPICRSITIQFIYDKDELLATANWNNNGDNSVSTPIPEAPKTIVAEPEPEWDARKPEQRILPGSENEQAGLFIFEALLEALKTDVLSRKQVFGLEPISDERWKKYILSFNGLSDENIKTYFRDHRLKKYSLEEVDTLFALFEGRRIVHQDKGGLAAAGIFLSLFLSLINLVTGFLGFTSFWWSSVGFGLMVFCMVQFNKIDKKRQQTLQNRYDELFPEK